MKEGDTPGSIVSCGGAAATEGGGAAAPFAPGSSALPRSLVPKLCLGTQVGEAPLRVWPPRGTRSRSSRTRAFPSRAWERGANEERGGTRGSEAAAISPGGRSHHAHPVHASDSPIGSNPDHGGGPGTASGRRRRNVHCASARRDDGPAGRARASAGRQRRDLPGGRSEGRPGRLPRPRSSRSHPRGPRRRRGLSRHGQLSAGRRRPQGPRRPARRRRPGGRGVGVVA